MWKTCPLCWQELYQEFLNKNQTINEIQQEYAGLVSTEWIEYYSEYGQEKAKFYHLNQSNSLVIKDNKGNIKIIEGAFNETYIREVIDAFLEGKIPPPSSPPLPLTGIFVLAFSFGVLDTFSPCLLVLLSFVLSFAVAKTSSFKKSFIYILIFGIGFALAATLLGLAVGLLFLYLPILHSALTWIVCILAILFGLNLLGLLKIQIETKPLIQKLSKKYIFTYTGLFLLGFLFYFLDPCIAPIFFAMIPLLAQAEFLLVLFLFCLGVILPFIAIGAVASSISKLTRVTYKHKSKIQALSGIILVSYSLYLIISYTF
ncbi:MAG: cytochrome c biogenesis protein CcdA [Candidatus Bathyarchaeia archaeon]